MWIFGLKGSLKGQDTDVSSGNQNVNRSNIQIENNSEDHVVCFKR